MRLEGLSLHSWLRLLCGFASGCSCSLRRPLLHPDALRVLRVFRKWPRKTRVVSEANVWSRAMIYAGLRVLRVSFFSSKEDLHSYNDTCNVHTYKKLA